MRPVKFHPSQATPSMLSYEDLPRLRTLMTGDEKHELASESTLDVLWVLYDRVLKVDPRAPADPYRDRFLLSKGHGPMAYYAVLAAKGFIPMDASPRSDGMTRSLVSTRTARSYPAWRSPADRWDTGCLSP